MIPGHGPWPFATAPLDAVPLRGGYADETADGPWTIPSDERFGANQMTTDTEGHSDYWKEKTQSLKNQGLVVAGHGDEVKLKPPPDHWSHVK